MTNNELATALEADAKSLDGYDWLESGSHGIVNGGYYADRLREASRRLREHDAARIRATEALSGVRATEDGGFTGDPVVDGIGALRAEVERLLVVVAHLDTLASQMRRDEANRVEQIKAHWSGEVERLRSCHEAGHACLRETHRAKAAEVERLRAERTKAQECAMAMRHERDEAVTEALCARDLRKLLDEADVEVGRLRAEVQRVANERDDAQQAYDDASLGLDRCRDTLRLAVARAECMEQAWSAEIEHANQWCVRARKAESWARRWKALAKALHADEIHYHEVTKYGQKLRVAASRSAQTASRLARAEKVIEAARESLRQMPAEVPAWETIRAALAAWDEEGRSDG